MTRPRHAEKRRGPVVAILALALAVLVVAGGLAIRFWIRPGAEAAIVSNDGSSSAAATSPSAAAPSSASTSSSAETSASQAAAEARATLKSCITRVRSTDEVLNQAAIGINNWSMHVQAQNDADHGKISVAHMNHTFKKTKAEGPDDVERYVKAKKDRQPVGDACDKREGATATVTRKLTACQKRIKAQQPALARAETAMGDWDHHLADMRRSASGEVAGKKAEEIWLATYRKAPKHLLPYEKAANEVNSAPACT